MTKQRNVRRRRAKRYLLREAKAGRTWPLGGYAEVYGAIAHRYGTTRAAERRHWRYWPKPRDHGV